MNGVPDRPSLWFRSTNRLNALIWWAPLPRRLKATLSGLVYRNPPMPEERVTEALEALQAAGVKTAIMGGWGVDALAGVQQRPHRDLDLLVDPTQFEQAREVLGALGYEEWNRSAYPSPLGNIVLLATETMRDPAMRVVDLHSTDLDGNGLELSDGQIGALRIVCISPRQQLKAQTGRSWTWGRIQRRRAMYATMTALISGAAGAELVGEAGSIATNEPGISRSADGEEGGAPTADEGDRLG